MQHAKRFKGDSGSDPFDDEDEWDDDDIVQLVNNDVPTMSQMSQVMKAPSAPVKRPNPSGTVGKLPKNTPSKSFVFRKPSDIYEHTSTQSKSKVTLNTTADDGRDVSGINALTKTLQDNISANCVPSNSTQSQLNDTKRRQLAQEGEIKWLRESLKDKDRLIGDLRGALLEESNKQKQQNMEKEKQYVRDIESLRAELQFKESELKQTSQSLECLKRAQKQEKPPRLRLGGDGFPEDAGFMRLKAQKTVSTNTETPMETEEGTSADNIWLKSSCRINVVSQQQCWTSDLVKTNLIGYLKLYERKQEADDVEVLLSQLLTSKVYNPDDLIYKISLIIDQPDTSQKPDVIVSAIQTIRVLINACSQHHDEKFSSQKREQRQRIVTSLVKSLKALFDMKPICCKQVQIEQESCLICIHHFFLSDKNTLPFHVDEELRVILVSSLRLCITSEYRPIVDQALLLSAQLVENGLDLHCTDCCLIEEICKLCFDISDAIARHTGKLIRALSCVTCRLCDDQTKTALCVHTNRVAPATILLLYHMISIYQMTTDVSTQLPIMPLMKMSLNILCLLEASSPEFEKNCHDLLSEFNYCLMVLRRIFDNHDDLDYGEYCTSV